MTSSNPVDGQIIHFDKAGRTALSSMGTPVFQDYDPQLPLFPVTSDLAVQRVPREEKTWQRSTDSFVVRALAILQMRETFQFDPLTGSPLTFVEPTVAKNAQGHVVFPRIDPAVIGLIELEDQDRILLGRNRYRGEFYSLVAGYVELGETLEEAMARETLEETGRRIRDITYVASQPWPYSGSLMAGMHAVTTDKEAICETDGELVDVVWASKSDIVTRRYELPHEGSIAYRLIQEWVMK